MTWQQDKERAEAGASWSATLVFVAMMTAFGALTGLALGLAAR